MPWASKLFVTLAVTAFAVQGFAARLTFQSTGTQATLTSTALRSNAAVPSREFSLSIPVADLETSEDGFQALSAPGLDLLATPGNPEVYTTGSLLAVPAGYEAVLSVVEMGSERVPTAGIRPFQKRFRCGTKRDIGFVFNSELYNSQSVYPPIAVGLQNVGQMQSLRLMRVAFYPFQVDFAHKELVVHHTVKVRVDFKRTGSRLSQAALPQSVGRLASEIVANPEALTATTLASTEPDVYLIVTADSLKASLQPLIEWKQMKGMKVDVVTFTEAGGTKEAVQAWIQKYYDAAVVKPSYLLMVGNKTTLPPFMESTGSGSAASDMKFSFLAGNDNVPDVLYGRLLADNASEADVQIAKWVSYEKSPDRTGNWYPQGLTIASSEGSGPSDKEYAGMIQAELTKNTYTTVDRFLEEDDSATFANISTAVNAGRTWIAYFGHGTGTAWGSTSDKFDVAAVGKLQNAGKLPILIDVACQNASWVKIANPFGKAWVTHQVNGVGAGAVGFYGGSVNISWHEPAVMSVGIAKYHFEKPVTSLGASVLAGQMYLVEKMGKGANTLDNLKWYNLLGDPSLTVRTANPKQYAFSHEFFSREDGRMNLSGTAKDSAGNGIAGLTVAVGKAGSAPVALATTDATGIANMVLPAVIDPGMTVTVTGYNADTFQAPLN